jgi:glycosyltransferase involved in cell wall biosynthesis
MAEEPVEGTRIHVGAPAGLNLQLLYVIGSLGTGGTESHLVNLLPRLQKSGWRLSLCCLSHRGTKAAELEARGIVVHSPPFERIIGTRFRLARWLLLVLGSLRLLQLLLRRPHAVHFFLPGAYLIGAPLALLTGVPIKLMSRRSLNHYQVHHPYLRMVELRLHRHMTALCGNSEAVLRQLIHDEGCPEGRVHLLYNGIDTARFKPPADRARLRSQLNLAPNAIVMVSVANLIPYKGHYDLLLALGTVKHKIATDWRLLCVGRNDGLLTDLRNVAERVDIGDRVSFLGECSDIPEILGAADIAISASHEEGFSNAILEAMATGLPIIATNVGGNAEAVLHGITGLIVPAREPVAFGQAILALAHDEDLRQRLGRAGRECAMERFSFDGCVAGYNALYGRLLNRIC